MILTQTEKDFIKQHPALQALINQAKQSVKKSSYVEAIKTYSRAVAIVSAMSTLTTQSENFLLVEKLQYEIVDCLAREAHPDITTRYANRIKLLEQAENLTQQVMDTLSTENSKAIGFNYTSKLLENRLSNENFNHSLDLFEKGFPSRASVSLLKLSYRQRQTPSKLELKAYAEQFERYADLLFKEIKSMPEAGLDINTITELYDQSDTIYKKYFSDDKKNYFNKQLELTSSKLNFYETTLGQQRIFCEKEICKITTKLIGYNATRAELETGYAYLFSQAIRQGHQFSALGYARKFIGTVSILPSTEEPIYKVELQEAKNFLKKHEQKRTITVASPTSSVFSSGLSPKKYWLKIHGEENDENTPKGNTPKRQKTTH